MSSSVWRRRCRRKSVAAHAPAAEPDAQALNDALLETLRKAMESQGKRLEESGLTSFSSAFSHQQLGDFFRDMGQGKEALRHYRKAHELVKKALVRDPRSDRGRANCAVTLALLSGKKLELDGDARAARKLLQDARTVQQDVSDRPRGNYYKPADNQRLQANYALGLGKISLELGDPAAARKYCAEALALRTRAAAAAAPGNARVSAVGYVIEARYYLGQACPRLGDADATEAEFAAARTACVNLIKQFPNYFDFKHDLGDVCGTCGDARLSFGRLAAARADYEASLPLIRHAVGRNPDSLRYQSSLALACYRLGVVAGAARDPDAAGAVRGGPGPAPAAGAGRSEQRVLRGRVGGQPGAVRPLPGGGAQGGCLTAADRAPSPATPAAGRLLRPLCRRQLGSGPAAAAGESPGDRPCRHRQGLQGCRDAADRPGPGAAAGRSDVPRPPREDPGPLKSVPAPTAATGLRCPSEEATAARQTPSAKGGEGLLVLRPRESIHYMEDGLRAPLPTCRKTSPCWTSGLRVPAARSD